MVKWWLLGCMGVLAGWCWAEPKIDFGGELRLRYLVESGMPSGLHDEMSYRDYTRFRTRLWGRVQEGRLTGFLRIANEFRHYFSQDALKGRQRFPDQTFIDLLYVDIEDVVDGVDLCLGRQELAYGEGRIISNGTGGDGSRTAYFDALKLQFDFDDERTLDVFATYQARHDWLPTVGHRHDPRSMDTKSYDYDITGSNHVEYGVGLYYQDRSDKAFGWDAYYIYKGEYGSKSTVIRKHPDLVNSTEDRFGWHTFGFRLLPQFTEHVSGEFEGAIQIGDESLFTGMIYTGLTYAPDWELKPAFTAAVYYLSGDRSGNRGSHAWHPVFSYNSDPGDTICALSNMDACTNLLYPHLKVSFTPAEYHSITVMTGPVFTPVSDARASGGHYSKSCGYHAQLAYSWKMGEALQIRYAKDLVFSLFIDYLRKGATFPREYHDDAIYAQAQLLWSF